jgi:hypothetical protein
VVTATARQGPAQPGTHTSGMHHGGQGFVRPTRVLRWEANSLRRSGTLSARTRSRSDDEVVLSPMARSSLATAVLIYVAVGPGMGRLWELLSELGACARARGVRAD